MRVSAQAERPAPAWLITESYEERPLGTLKSGKEAEVFLVERVSATGSCLLAHREDDGILMEFLGDGLQAAPRIVNARLERTQLIGAWEQLLTSLRALTGRHGVVIDPERVFARLMSEMW